MPSWIAILGGLLLMMGQHDRSESLFYYFRIEDQVPENHLLRLIDRHVSFDFVREKLRDSYSETGRPSIDPEVLLRVGNAIMVSDRKIWWPGTVLDKITRDRSCLFKSRYANRETANVQQNRSS
jgi:hypothetical protein